jgi:Protein of unknown function (DUF2490)
VVLTKPIFNKFGMKIYISILLMLLGASSMTAQKVVNEEEQLWFGAFNQTRFTNRWGLWTDMHYRMKEHFVGDFSQFLIRTGPTFYVTDDVRITAAYAFVLTGPGDGRNIALPEHRPWQQVQWFTRWPKVRLMQWVRLEERFRRKLLTPDELGDGYNFNPRIRYNMALFLPLTRKGLQPGGLQFLLNNEVMVNFGKNIVYNHFDQNRFFAGLVYQLNPHAQIHAGYMNLYQQQAVGNVFRNQHTIRVYYFHNFDLRKAQKN